MASLTTELPTWDTTSEFADAMDAKDPLRSFRDEFHFPVVPDTATHRAPGSKTIYLCGNSLGLQPANTDKYVTEELAKWRKFGVEGHFPDVNPEHPWVAADEDAREDMAMIVGAKPVEGNFVFFLNLRSLCFVLCSLFWLARV